MAWTIHTRFLPFSYTNFDIEPPMGPIILDTEMHARRGLKRCNYGLPNCGNHIPDDLWPRSALSKTDRKIFPHIIGLDGFYGYSEPLKELIERLEPGIHDFRPVDVFKKDRTPAEPAFYAVNINNIVPDSVDFSEAPPGRKKYYGDHLKLLPLRESDSGKIFIFSRAVTGKHLWISDEIVGRPVTMSNQLYDEAKKAKYLRGYYGIELVEI